VRLGADPAIRRPRSAERRDGFKSAANTTDLLSKKVGLEPALEALAPMSPPNVKRH